MAAVSPTLPAVCQLEEGKERWQRWGRGALACAPPTPTPKPRALGAGEGGRCVSLGDPRRPVAPGGGSTGPRLVTPPGFSVRFPAPRGR